MIKLAKSSVLLFLLIQSLWAIDGIAKPQHCTSSILIPSRFVDLVCVNGRCTGEIPMMGVHIGGVCEDDATFVADGKIPSVPFSGYCRSGLVLINTYSQNIPLYGECTQSNEYAGLFYTITQDFSTSSTASCEANGRFRIYIEGGTKGVTGRCR